MSEPLISQKETEKLIAEAMEKSPEFAAKFHYWFRIRNRMPDQVWLLKNLQKVLGTTRIQLLIGEAAVIASKPLPLRLAHKFGKNVKELFSK